MLLDPSVAKLLFTIVLSTAQGPEAVNRQLPLQVRDRGNMWLVTGTPYTDEQRQSRFCMCHMFFSKRSAEVTGIDCHARMIVTHKEEVEWRKRLTPEQYDRAFGPDTVFEPNGVRDLWSVLYHGIVTTPTAAVEYAAALMRTTPRWATVTPGDLIATERDKVWHISGRHQGTGDLLTISRATGKVLSGDL